MNICSKQSIRKSNFKNRAAGILLCLAITAAFMITSLFVGATDISVQDTLSYILGGRTEGPAADIIRYVRMPRILSSYVCGASLAAAGLLLQAVLNNPLASPGIIGINSGAGFFVVLSAVLFPYAYYAKFAAAFAGAMLTALLVYGIAKKTGSSRIAIVLSGIAISSIMAAGIDTVITLKPEAIMDKTAFYIGGFSAVSMETLGYAASIAAACMAGSFLLASRLNVMMLGDEVATSLGLNVQLCRFLSIGCAALLAASAVCIGGLISFVGLIVPHIVRSFLGADHRWLVPYTFLTGGLFLLACDTLARVIFAPYEFPVGILLSFLGAPFFLSLLLNKKRRFEI